ncbi:MAG TPA: DNA polymerase III subunit epsilon [Coxiellaceae bacterium]|nr:DNA polymerase III subunit epsilon [Coxiellaceae bacterium]
MSERQIVLDTETTGLEFSQGHRVIEIGCVELINRRITGSTFHHYINPTRLIEREAVEVHGITDDFLKDKPVFPDIAKDFLAYVKDAELIIHNAPFDMGFINGELKLWNKEALDLETLCGVIDTLPMARKKHPGQRNSLDALCQRYSVDNSKRDWHGALLDAELLAQVYLLMTGGQTNLFGVDDTPHTEHSFQMPADIRRLPVDRESLPVVWATSEELQTHEAFMRKLKKPVGADRGLPGNT